MSREEKIYIEKLWFTLCANPPMVISIDFVGWFRNEQHDRNNDPTTTVARFNTQIRYDVSVWWCVSQTNVFTIAAMPESAHIRHIRATIRSQNERKLSNMGDMS